MDMAEGSLAARDPWWRRWLEPVVAVAIVTVLVMALVMLGVAGFQSLKGDIAASEARQTEAIVASETRQKEAIVASEVRQREDLKELKADLKGDMADLRADNRALSDKLDRVLETLLAGNP